MRLAPGMKLLLKIRRCEPAADHIPATRVVRHAFLEQAPENLTAQPLLLVN